MSIISPFKKNKSSKVNPYFDNSSRVKRILYRVKSYHQIFQNAVSKGISVSDLLRSQFPFTFDDAPEPPIVALEFTNYCNLKCPYCTSPLGERKRGYMDPKVFYRVLEDLQKMKPNRIQLVGNGESTLHPNFSEFINELGKTGKYISMVTNGQWIHPETSRRILEAPLDLVEISIDAGGKEGYESSRINGKFDRLLDNLSDLNSLRKELKAKTLINIRVMLRPSQMNTFQQELEFWQKYGDKVMPQYITKINGTDYDDDVFLPIQTKTESFPKCSMPFKHMEVKYTGDVLMCYYTPFQIGYPGLVIGNVQNSTINEIWNCEIMKEYREAHRKRMESKMPVCKGCPGT